MSNKLWNLRKIIDLEKWQTLQDWLSSTTKMAMITVDYKGAPVTKHSLCTPFCQAVRKDPKLFNLCKKCDARGGLQAVRQNAPYIYYCHCHIVDLAVPIEVDGKYLGAIMAGQVRLADAGQVSLEQIVTVAGKANEQKKAALADLYDHMPILSFDEVQGIAEMLFQLANYITEEAMNKNLLIEAREKMQQPEICLAPNVADIHSGGNATLKPVFSYLNEHKNETVSLKKAAALCHISTSHFSRLFVKETGENYSNFIAQLKIKWSKELLAKTDMSVSRISEELGYSEACYFIKIFKKHEGMTPLAYRKNYTG